MLAKLLCNSAVIYDFIGLAPTRHFVGTTNQEVGATTGPLRVPFSRAQSS